MTTLYIWSWIFLILYTAAMLLIGWIGMRKVSGSDDFATARNSYGALFLAFAFTATTASGGTFIGGPAWGYMYGFSALTYTLVYPIAVYLGIYFCFKVVTRLGNSYSSRSIPEFLGHRFQSSALRLLVAVFSLMLLFYLSAQLVAGLVMFETMLGLSQGMALTLTTIVLLVYVVLGGAHSDIITDGFQGFTMLVIAVIVVAIFFMATNIEGGITGLFNKLRTADPALLSFRNKQSDIFDSNWDIVAIFLAHLPLGMLPHLGNKLWALKEGESKAAFLSFCTGFGLLLGAITLGGILARAVLGDTLLDAGGANQAIPTLFVELFPHWLAALLGIAILCAIMSTADGLVISTSQVFANDIYRCSLAARLHPDATPKEIDESVLKISRWSVIFVLLGAATLAWFQLDQNVALLIWVGLGGMMAALSGPFMIGLFWQRTTKAGAIAGFIAGAFAFIVFKMGLIPGGLENHATAGDIVSWLRAQQPNSFSCTALGQFFSVSTTVIVSLFTKPLPEAHLQLIFPGRVAVSATIDATLQQTMGTQPDGR